MHGGFQTWYTGTLKDRKTGTGAPHPKSPINNEPLPILKVKTSNFVERLIECPLDPWRYTQMSSNKINVFFPEQMAKLGCPLCRYLNLIYVINTPRPAILGLPSCSRLRIVHLNCSVQFRKYGQLVTISKEQDIKNLNLINSKDDLITAYPDQFEGIGKFPGIYHIYLREDAIPIVHTPRKCPITIRTLVDKKPDSQISY